jgi:pyruvate dehydrogenase E2 component (dihydrolipoamide acetyltransferase)
MSNAAAPSRPGAPGQQRRWRPSRARARRRWQRRWRARHEIPHYYLTTRIDLSRALDWLGAENARRALADRLLPAALLLRAVALAAREAPEITGFFVDGTLRPAACVHLGVGVSLRQDTRRAHSARGHLT